LIRWYFRDTRQR